MARRPTAPRPVRPATGGAASPRRTATAPPARTSEEKTSSADATASRRGGRPAPAESAPRRTAGDRSTSTSARRTTATRPSSAPKESTRTRTDHPADRAVEGTATSGTGTTADASGKGPRRVIHAADRFRDLVRTRPWRRRRRAILLTAAAVVVLLVAATIAAVTVPALSVRQVEVQGLGYVQESAVDDAVSGYRGDSVLLLPTDRIAGEVEKVPGVASATVERSWPDGMRVEVTERTAIASLTTQDGSTVLLDASGTELPEAAGQGASPVPLTLAADAADPDGARTAMISVLADMPSTLRGGITSMTASSPSDVTFTLEVEDGGTRTVVWGDAADSSLKAQVVQALLKEPGQEIDVSSPVAPVTR